MYPRYRAGIALQARLSMSIVGVKSQPSWYPGLVARRRGGVEAQVARRHRVANLPRVVVDDLIGRGRRLVDPARRSAAVPAGRGVGIVIANAATDQRRRFASAEAEERGCHEHERHNTPSTHRILLDKR